MSRRAWGVVVGGLAVIAVGAGSWWLYRREPPVGIASGEFAFRGHTGLFTLKPTYCRRGVGLRGAGLYDQAAPALAFGYFNDLDGGEWVEAQGPGVSATRFDREDCPVFDAKVQSERGIVSGHLLIVCDAAVSPGITHAEGEATFHGCGEATVR